MNRIGHLAGERKTGSVDRLMCRSRIGYIGNLEDQRRIGYTGILAGQRRMDSIVRLVDLGMLGSIVPSAGPGRTGRVGYQIKGSRIGSVCPDYFASRNCSDRTERPPIYFEHFAHTGSYRNMFEGYRHLYADQAVGIAHPMARTGSHLADPVACTLLAELCQSMC